MASLLVFVSCLFVICCYGRVDAFESKKEIDSFYDDETDSKWIIYSGNVKDDFAAKWDDNPKWDFINENMQTNKGHIITRKCENVFGSLLCLCQFKKLVGKSHDCYAQNQAQKQSKKTNNAAAYSDPSNYLFESNENENEIIARKEKQIEKEIAAAQIEADNDELSDDEIEDLEDEVLDLIDEEVDAEMDIDDEEQSEDENEDAVVNNDISALGEEIGSQNELIKEQNELIQELREDNAMKMELIDILEDDDNEEDAFSDADSDIDDVADVYDSDVDVDEYENENVKTLKVAAKEVDDAIDVAYAYDDDADVNNDDEFDDEFEDEAESELNDLVEVEQNEAYYDDNHIDEAMQDYHFVYEEDDDKEDLEREEAEALIKDTVWGLEIYSVAFGVLCCLCVCCWAQKTKCCGLVRRSKDDSEYSYAAYHSQHNFGNCEEEELENDIEMGVDQEEVAYINGNQ